MILDSCYSGTLFRRSPILQEADPKSGRGGGRGVPGPAAIEPVANDNFRYYFRHPAFLGIAAGRLTPVADGQGPDRHSIFTSTFLEVMRERADSLRRDQAFTFTQLSAQVEDRVANALGSGQIPLSGSLVEDWDGNFVFLPTRYRQTPHEASAERQRLAQLRLVRMHVSNATRAVEAGNYFEALPWLAESVALDHDNPDRVRIDRIRFGMALDDSPWFERAWFHKESVNQLAFSPDGSILATASEDGRVGIWDVRTGAPARRKFRWTTRCAASLLAPTEANSRPAPETKAVGAAEAKPGSSMCEAVSPSPLPCTTQGNRKTIPW